MKKVLWGIAIVGLAVIAGIAYYLFMLTAPVEIASTPPVAPTLAVASAPTQAQAVSATDVAAGISEPAATYTSEPTKAVAGISTDMAAGISEPMATYTGEPAEPPSADVSEPAATAAVMGEATGVKVYRIDSAQSSASYSVGETFFDQRGHITAVGTTNAVAGDIMVDHTNLSASQVGEIVVDISQLKTDEPMRDNAIRRQWLQSARYPLATLKNSTLSELPARWSEGQPLTFKITGDMTVRDTTQQVTWDVTATIEGGTLRAKATTSLKMSRFGVQPPSIPTLQVEDDMTLALDLVATAVD